MLKVALIAAAVAVVASTAVATNIDLETGASPAGDVACHPVQSLDLACTMRVIDANGDGTISAAELAGFAAPAPVVVDDWTPLHPPRSTGLDFKDAATEPAVPPPAPLEGEGSHRLMPALFALGALVVLLRRRPT
jgi:hypothetical protein